MDDNEFDADDEENEEEKEPSREYLRDIFEQIQPVTRTDFTPGVYRHAANRRFSGNKRGYLPIVAEDYTYTMDIMFFNFIIEENTLKEKISQRKTRGKWLVKEHGQWGDEPPVIGGLILVETISRKIFFYKLCSKDPREVLHAFKDFLYDVGGKVARIISDRGPEYSLIKKYNEKRKLFRYWQVNASQNHHTALSRVDRAIRTLKGIIATYYAEYRSADWEEVIYTLVRTYNNTIHKSLFLRDWLKRKYKYTPEQVWNNQELRRKIKIKDYLEKYENYKYYDNNFHPGDIVFYRLLPKQAKNKNTKGYLSIYPAKIIRRIGNSYEIQLKGYKAKEHEDDEYIEDVLVDQRNKNYNSFNGSKIVVPGRDIIPANKIKIQQIFKVNIQEH